MYLKLAIRNAKRSAFDYLIYMATITLLVVIMVFSNALAALGRVEAGFKTASLPVLITIILIILVEYINRFLLKQRAREFAAYLLAGMEKPVLSRLFTAEFLIIGMACFAAGAIIGHFVYYSFLLLKVRSMINMDPPLLFILQNTAQAFFYFCIAEAFSAFRIRRRLSVLEIKELINEKKRIHLPGKPSFCICFGIIFAVSFLFLIVFILGITLPESGRYYFLVSFIMFPLLLAVFSFYQWLFRTLTLKRMDQSRFFYRNDRLIITAQLLSESKSSALLNGLFCTCLLLSAVSFLIGSLFLQPEFSIFGEQDSKWMGILQICLCIIFLIIYFSMQCLKQLIETNNLKKDYELLHYMGWPSSRIKSIFREQTLIRFLLPALPCFALLIISIPLFNYRLNKILPFSLKNNLLLYAGLFLLCFSVVCGIYFAVLIKEADIQKLRSASK